MCSDIQTDFTNSCIFTAHICKIQQAIIEEDSSLTYLKLGRQFNVSDKMVDNTCTVYKTYRLNMLVLQTLSYVHKSQSLHIVSTVSHPYSIECLAKTERGSNISLPSPPNTSFHLRMCRQRKITDTQKQDCVFV